MTRRARAAATAVGLALLVVHVALAIALARASRATSLEVAWNPANPRQSEWVSGDPDRATLTVDGVPDRAGPLAPGLRHIAWTERYRGGHIRSVGASALVGRRQAPSSPPCGIRVRVSQALLDDGARSPGTVAHLAHALLTRELGGISVWPLGDFVEVTTLRLRWSEGGGEARTVLGARLEGLPPAFIALHMEIQFEKGRVPIFVALVPSLADGTLRLRTLATARAVANQRIHRIVLALLRGDRRATAAAEEELASSMANVLEPPPPLSLGRLGGGAELRVRYCRGEALRFRDGEYAEIPLALELDHERDGVAPIEFDLPRHQRPDSIDGAIQVEVDINAMGALLHQLWAVGFFERVLAGADVAGRFNGDPLVRELLSVRIDNPRLVHPPVVEIARRPNDFSLAAALEFLVSDGELNTPAHLFARSELAAATDGNRLLDSVDVAAVALSCRPRPNRLRACYATLASALAERAPEAAAVLQETLENSFRSLLVERTIAIDGVPNPLRIRGVAGRSRDGRLQIRIDGSLQPP